ncbi:unnamed protein product [Rotaria magnacalcarata]|uniref:PDZ domain-containing protein n=7 Tax=Rotaria TaxID=231623 RepID=A0A816UG99_9BILA|nr:unnamed protein product [Rotaria magnacalcarata]CAF1682072.1 unnamed protein product [Rotaria magnacalcarata]CAF1952960.1 unnamed protein product [Rotaria magnacalcarata]CAF2041333.1 unnamed protein product [Rotaria magnacalcarata]CAF2113296.1 unnamed protein product [Rotaria magnacalcarata]
MPIFPPKRKSQAKKDDPTNGVIPSISDITTNTSAPNTNSSAVTNSSRPSSFSSSSSRRSTASSSNGDSRVDPPKLIFHCQLAHGSPTGLIAGFSNVRELYQKIADCFEIPVPTILFCTLNTHKIDMSQLLGGQIGLTDFIFAHVKGQAKEIDIVKSEAALGLTITDNGAGYAFIKRIKEGSVIDRLKTLVKVGDHIEKINDKSLVGSRHFEVAKMLKELPVGSTFTMRLVEPNAFGFHIEPAKRGRKTGDVKNGTKTLRFKADGRASVEDIDDTMVKAIDRINGLLETFMGINDSDLAQQIWDFAQNKTNPSDFAMAIDESEIGAFNFTDEFIFDLWAAIDDIKAGRIKDRDYEDERL